MNKYRIRNSKNQQVHPDPLIFGSGSSYLIGSGKIMLTGRFNCDCNSLFIYLYGVYNWPCLLTWYLFSECLKCKHKRKWWTQFVPYKPSLVGTNLIKMSSVLKFFKSDKKKKNSGQYLEIAEIGMPTQVSAGLSEIM